MPDAAAHGDSIDTTRNNVVMSRNKRVNGKATVIGTTGLIDGKSTVKIDDDERINGAALTCCCIVKAK